MNKIRSSNLWTNLQDIAIFLFFICFTIVIWLSINFNIRASGYLLFIEFQNAYGIKEGTSIRMRGVNIGYVKNLKINLNSILVLVNIQSQNILIPKNSIIETNQTGLLNDTVIDIIPLETIDIKYLGNINVISKECMKSSLVCHLSYLQGDRGLNYDDLIRAATRISQRFDDPTFFKILYLFLQNSIELSDNLCSITFDISSFISIFYNYLSKFLKGHL